MKKILKIIFLLTLCLFLFVGCTKEGSKKPKEVKTETTNILANKYISFLGDSISTYQGYSNNCERTNSTICDNKIYYKGYNHILDVNETWWQQTVNNTGLKLLVNNSLSGDKVTTKAQLRNQQLHNDIQEVIINPDIIVVYIGINDFIKEVPNEEFHLAYETMIATMKSTYPKSDIFLLNLLPNTTTLRSEEDLKSYNDYIAMVANKFNATLVDINNLSGISIATCNTHMADIKCLHPNKEGMTAMANVVTDSILNKYLKTEEVKEEIININAKQPQYNYFKDILIILLLSLTIIVGIIVTTIYNKLTK